ncbi:MAG: hypothetical protein OEW80_03830 [Gemmatimonadota bacterium]|nr:hypothetical protein [Gemmatimonadota bacterium]
MRTSIRLKLDMAGRAVEFVRAHPDDNPATTVVATRLTGLTARASQLLQQQRTPQLAVASSVSLKADLRDTLEEYFVSLVGIARAAAEDNPDISVHRRIPRRRTNEATFLTTARVAVAEAAGLKAVLEPYGFTDALLEAMNGDLDAYEAAISRQRNAAAAQVGAGAELRAVVEDVMGVVRNLDALYRVRFRDDADLRAAWKSARNVAWRAPEGAADVSRAA